MLKRIKRKIANRLLRYLYKAVTEDDFLKWNGKTLMLNGVTLTPQRIDEIRSSAETIKSMELWKLLCKDIEYTANTNLFKKSQTTDDMIFPKAVLYAVDVMEQKLENLSKIKT